MNHYIILAKKTDVVAVECDQDFTKKTLAKYQEQGFAIVDKNMASQTHLQAVQTWKNAHDKHTKKHWVQAIAAVLTLPGCLLWILISVDNNAFPPILGFIYAGYISIVGLNKAPLFRYVLLGLIALFLFADYTGFRYAYADYTLYALWGILLGTLIQCIFPIIDKRQ